MDRSPLPPAPPNSLAGLSLHGALRPSKPVAGNERLPCRLAAPGLEGDDRTAAHHHKSASGSTVARARSAASAFPSSNSASSSALRSGGYQSVDAAEQDRSGRNLGSDETQMPNVPTAAKNAAPAKRPPRPKLTTNGQNKIGPPRFHLGCNWAQHPNCRVQERGAVHARLPTPRASLQNPHPADIQFMLCRREFMFSK
jgi:hypothetical protein